jgi:RNA polymerase sigma factor (sigma-70 family)
MAVRPTPLRAGATRASADSVPTSGLSGDTHSDPGAEICETLYERHSQRLLRYCLFQLGGQRQEAEDAVQITFLHAWRALQRGQRPRSEVAWLLRIARNVCVCRRRELRRARRIETVDPQLLAETVAADGAESVDISELRGILADLPAPQRQALMLREWQGLSYREIAEEMNRSVANVEALIFRARAAVSAALQGQPAGRRAGRLPGVLGIVDLLRHWKACCASVVPPKALGAGVVAGAMAIGGGYGVGRAVELGDQPARQPAAASTTDAGQSPAEDTIPPPPTQRDRATVQGRRSEPNHDNQVGLISTGTAPPKSVPAAQGMAAEVPAAVPPAAVKPQPGRPSAAAPVSSPGLADAEIPAVEIDHTLPDAVDVAVQLAEDTIDQTADVVSEAIGPVTDQVPAFQQSGQPVDQAVDEVGELADPVVGALP